MAGFLALGDCRARFVARSLVSWAGRLRNIAALKKADSGFPESAFAVVGR